MRWVAPPDDLRPWTDGGVVVLAPATLPALVPVVVGLLLKKMPVLGLRVPLCVKLCTPVPWADRLRLVLNVLLPKSTPKVPDCTVAGNISLAALR